MAAGLRSLPAGGFKSARDFEHHLDARHALLAMSDLYRLPAIDFVGILFVCAESDELMGGHHAVFIQSSAPSSQGHICDQLCTVFRAQ